MNFVWFLCPFQTQRLNRRVHRLHMLSVCIPNHNKIAPCGMIKVFELNWIELKLNNDLTIVSMNTISLLSQLRMASLHYSLSSDFKWLMCPFKIELLLYLTPLHSSYDWCVHEKSKGLFTICTDFMWLLCPSQIQKLQNLLSQWISCVYYKSKCGITHRVFKFVWLLCPFQTESPSQQGNKNNA